LRAKAIPLRAPGRRGRSLLATVMSHPPSHPPSTSSRLVLAPPQRPPTVSCLPPWEATRQSESTGQESQEERGRPRPIRLSSVDRPSCRCRERVHDSGSQGLGNVWVRHAGDRSRQPLDAQASCVVSERRKTRATPRRRAQRLTEPRVHDGVAATRAHPVGGQLARPRAGKSEYRLRGIVIDPTEGLARGELTEVEPRAGSAKVGQTTRRFGYGVCGNTAPLLSPAIPTPGLERLHPHILKLILADLPLRRETEATQRLICKPPSYSRNRGIKRAIVPALNNVNLSGRPVVSEFDVLDIITIGFVWSLEVSAHRRVQNDPPPTIRPVRSSGDSPGTK